MNKDDRKTLKNFGTRVRKLREGLGYSQEKFAEKVQLHRTYIGMVERGEKNIALINITKIAKGLNVSVNELFRTELKDEKEN
ncbi:helix-turn-helix transcriptional regulator [Leuconostoc mesenteroides]|uniref:helix-turn-helix domain-containing protein n=1 Tax=Leuconostoc mesenteroides TaxID=1245 RepID=UPI001CBF3D3F|nr:helix-turn-helix transcriptional regulator [Leuconostoc mesenteroides]MBZ1540496.1 helix-turn-helix transcriptional regulator [Leuconostoc mesenteroides]